MKSEAARGLLRMMSNYARLAVTLAMGLVLARFTLHWVGNDGAGLILFLGANVGIAAMFREITIRAVVQELAHADHSEDRDHFRRVLSSAMALSSVMSFVAAAVFAVLYFTLPLFEIPPELMAPARAMVVSQGIYIMLYTWLTPIYNMLLVRERFVAQNFWAIIERAAWLGSALLLSYGFGMNGNPTRDLTAFAWCISAFNCSTYLIPVAWLLVANPELRPRRELVTPEIRRQLTRNTGRYIAVEAASALHEKVGMMIMNYYFGLAAGNLVFGMALQFVSYVRQATQGVTFGIEAVSARVSTRKKDSMSALVHHGTRLHGLVALPAGVCAFFLAEPLIRLWIGSKIEHPEIYLPRIGAVAQILVIALTARAISDGWMMILYGAGHLKRYAPLVLAGGIANPVFSIALLLVAPERVALYVVPTVFCVVYTAVHFFMLPRVAASCLSIRYGEIFSPLLRPAIATALSTPVLLLAGRLFARTGWHWNPYTTGAAVMAFGVVFGLLSALIVLTPQERDRFLWSPLRKVWGRSLPAGGA